MSEWKLRPDPAECKIYAEISIQKARKPLNFIVAARAGE